MVPVLMLSPGIFGVEIDSVRFSMSGFSTLLRALIFAPNCPDVTSFTNVKKDGHMMSVLERACFSPLVFAATGGMGPTASNNGFQEACFNVGYKKRSINCSKCLFWLRCRLCFSLLRSAVMCLRGHSSSVGHPSTTNIDLAYSEGRLEFGGPV